MPRVAEKIDALAKPEAKWDHDTYGMKRAGMHPREQDLDLGRGLDLRQLTHPLSFLRVARGWL
jgi:hypothetical protein